MSEVAVVDVAPPPAAQGTLDVRDLVVKLNAPAGVIKPVDGVSISIRPGERVAIVGETGCGKSLFLRGLLRFIPSSVLQSVDGSATFDGTDLVQLSDRKLRAFRGREIAMIFQDAMAYLNPTMTIGKQIAEVLTGTAEEKRQRTSDLLRSVGLDSSHDYQKLYPHELSGGMRQRVLIAIALANDPKILIADEPTTALDVTVQAQILRTIVDVVESRQMSLLLVTHDLGVVAEACERVYVMYAGQVVEHGSVREVFDNPKHPYTRGLLQCVLNVDGPRPTMLATVPGTVPSPSAMPTGCRFRPRCPDAMPVCTTNPTMIETGPASGVRCWLHAPAEVAEDAG
jgi:peptide/nickel transport system ATP-binding protein/peptide/nickel transport system permease protein